MTATVIKKSGLNNSYFAKLGLYIFMIMICYGRVDTLNYAKGKRQALSYWKIINLTNLFTKLIETKQLNSKHGFFFARFETSLRA